MQATNQTVSDAEVAKFNAMAARWWDVRGPMRELHRMNRLRTGWVNDRIQRRFGAGGVRLLDIGCGAGLASEAFARMGHDVTGLDAAPDAIEAARAHAAAEGLAVAYRVGLAGDLLAETARFQVITALEVIEHVPDQAGFVATLARLLAPGGLLFVSTLNRTARSYAFAIVGAERLARIVPRGTHDWRAFITPVELSRDMRAAGLTMADLSGMTLDVLAGSWRASRDTGVNYIAMGEAGPIWQDAADTVHRDDPNVRHAL